MADDPNVNDGTDDDGDGNDDAGSGSVTPEEHAAVVAERDRLKAQADKARTQAAREAKAKADAERKAAKEAEGDEKLKAALEAAEKSNAELQAKLHGTMARALAKERGAVDPKVVVRLIDFDDLTDPSDEDEVGEAIDALLEEKPYLKEAKKVGSDAGKGGAGNKEVTTDINAALRRATGRK